MPTPNDTLKIAIISQFRTQRAFLSSLSDSPNGIQLTENRLSKIICGVVSPRPEEKRHIAWKLQKPISVLFGEEGSDGR